LYGTTFSHFCSSSVRPKTSPSAFGLLGAGGHLSEAQGRRPFLGLPDLQGHFGPGQAAGYLAGDDLFGDVVPVHACSSMGIAVVDPPVPSKEGASALAELPLADQADASVQIVG
jgi:hypothetical protein